MSIARDGVAAVTNSNTGFTLTIPNFDTGSGSNKILRVSVMTPTDDLTGVTFNGSACSLVKKNSFWSVQEWAFVNPSGTHDVVITNSGFHFMMAIVKVYTGMNQSVTPDAISASTDVASFATNLQMSVTTVADNCWSWYSVVNSNTSSSPSAGSGSSLVATILDGTNGSLTMFDSNADLTPAGAKTSNATHGSNSNWNGVLTSWAPAGGGGGGSSWGGLLSTGANRLVRTF